MLKCVEVSSDEFKKPVWITKMHGKYNLPEPFEEITESDFIHYFPVCPPRFIEYRQVMVKGYLDCDIYWFGEYAIAIVFPTDWTIDNRLHSGIRYKKRLKFFYVGCKHEYEELSPKEAAMYGIKHFGCCWHVVRCKKCGYIMAYDSSG